MKAAVESYFGDRRSPRSRRPRPRSSPACPKSPSNYDLVRNADRASARRPSARTRSARRRELVVPRGHDDRRAAQLRSSTCSPRAGRRCRATEYTRRRLPGRQGRRGRPRQPDHAALDRAAFRLGRPRRADRAPVRRGRDDLRRTRARRAADHDDPRPAPPEDRREVGRGGRPRARTAQGPGGRRQGARLRRVPEPGCGTSRARTSATARSSRSTTRPASSSPTSGRPSYYATTSRPEFQPQYDVVGQGYPPAGLGVQAVQLRGRHRRRHAHRRHRCSWTPPRTSAAATRPADADNLERGPVRVRNALQFSLNIPSVKAMAINEPDHVFDRGQGLRDELPEDETERRAGPGPRRRGGPAGRPRDGLRHARQRRQDDRPHDDPRDPAIASGKDVVDPYVPPAGEQVVSPQAAYIVTDILAGNTNPNVNPFWGSSPSDGPDGRRPGDAQDRHEQRRQGPQRLRLHRPADRGGPGRRAPTRSRSASGTATATTRRSRPRARPLFSIDVSTYVWQGFLQEASRKWPVTRLRSGRRRPDPRRDRSVDRDAGARRRRVGQRVVHRRHRAQGRPGRGHLRHRRPERGAGRSRPSFGNWMEADRELDPAGGTRSRHRRRPEPDPDRVLLQRRRSSRTAPRGARSSVGDGCGEPSPSPSCFPLPTPDASGVIPSFAVPSPSGSEVAALPCPPASPSASPSESRRRRTPEATPPTRRPSRRRNRPRSRRPSRPRSRHPSRRRPRADPGRPRRDGALTGPADRRVRYDRRRDRRRSRPGRPAGRPDHPRPARLDGPGRRALGRPRPQRVGQDDAALGGRADAVADRGHRRGPGRALRPGRRRASSGGGSGSAGSAVEAVLRADLTPVDLVMTARHAATEPWWHDYTDDGPGAGPDRARAGSGWRRAPTSRSGRCPPASGGGPRSPGR